MMISVPDVLGDHVLQTERFYRQCDNQPAAALDMSAVRFVRPYGVIALICAARLHHQATGQPLLLAHMPLDVYQYLERVDLFAQMGGYFAVDAPLSSTFDREQPTPNLLEITPIASPQDVLQVITQAERIFAYWLQTSNLRSLLSVLSELCANLYQHSQDPHAALLIQTHKAVSRGSVRVRIALGDVGVGVRGSLSTRHTLGTHPIDYLHAATSGTTSRQNGRGGLGLRIVQQTVQACGGYFWLRSETAALLLNEDGERIAYSDLPPIQGTQIAVELHAPLHDGDSPL